MSEELFEATCTKCFGTVPLTPAEADELIAWDGSFTCGRCQPLTDLIERLAALHEQRESRRLWAALMLALDVETLESIRLGVPVHRRKLDPNVLRRVARGGRIAADAWITITPEMLDAIDEAGPFR